MFSILSVSLTQLKAGNNSEKLKNEINKTTIVVSIKNNYPKQSITI